MLKTRAIRALSYRHPLVHSRRKLTHKVAVVGSGPSGFYAITELFKHESKLQPSGTEAVHLEIALFDRLPTPFGLSRYGVAPDHLEVKNCEETFTAAVESHRSKFTYVGNVHVGSDLKISDLRRNFNSVVLAYGNTRENKLGLANEDHPMVINSKKFVAWYNGEPNVLDHFTPPDLSTVKKVTVIGNGNVAMDVSRLLLMPGDSEILQKSDISPVALENIAGNAVKELNIVARRGVLESKFTTKEIRELFQLEEFGVRCRGIFPESLVDYLQPFLKKLERASKRKFETILKFLKPVSERQVKYSVPDTVSKQWSLQYLKSPHEIKVDENDASRLKSIVFQKNRLVQKDLTSEATIEPIEGEFEEQETDLIITSVGFKGEPLESDSDLKFDSKRGIIVNKNFRVLNNKDEVIDGLYTTGWIGNNSKGPILNTLVSSSELSETIIKDVNNNNNKKHERLQEVPGLAGLDSLKGKEVTNWEDWEKLNEFEIKFGSQYGKARWKIPTVELMLEILRSNEAIDGKIDRFRDSIVNYGRR
jgi:adrenodoxin-NADP+ reductase